MAKKILFLPTILIVIFDTYPSKSNSCFIITSAPTIQTEKPKTLSTLTQKDVRETCLCTACIGGGLAALATPVPSIVCAKTSLCIACLLNCGLICMLWKAEQKYKP